MRTADCGAILLLPVALHPIRRVTVNKPLGLFPKLCDAASAEISAKKYNNGTHFARLSEAVRNRGAGYSWSSHL
jgi:hypothetical protein